MEIRYEDENSQTRLLTVHPGSFSVDPTYLDRDLCGIAKTMIEYAEIESILKTEVERKENHIDKFEADLEIALRSKAQADTVKITERAVESLIKANEDRVKLLESLRVSRDNFNKIKWVMLTIKSKLEVLKTLAYRDNAIIKADR